jgi:hypothetical protein
MHPKPSSHSGRIVGNNEAAGAADAAREIIRDDMRWYLRLFSAALEMPAFTFSLKQKAKKHPFKFHSRPHLPRPPQTPAASF